MQYSIRQSISSSAKIFSRELNSKEMKSSFVQRHCLALEFLLSHSRLSYTAGRVRRGKGMNWGSYEEPERSRRRATRSERRHHRRTDIGRRGETTTHALNSDSPGRQLAMRVAFFLLIFTPAPHASDPPRFFLVSLLMHFVPFNGHFAPAL